MREATEGTQRAASAQFPSCVCTEDELLRDDLLLFCATSG